jgi:outer membrane protein TolC
LLDVHEAEEQARRRSIAAGSQQRIVALLEKRLQAGVISVAAVGPARLAALQAGALASAAKQQIPLARQRLATALGLPRTALAGVRLSAPTPIPRFSPAQLEAARWLSLCSRSDVLAALAHYETSDAAFALEVAKQYPDFHLGPGYQWDQGQNKWTLGLTLELPVFGHNEGPLAEAEARRREAAADFLAVQAQAVAAVDEAALLLASAAAQVEALQHMQAQLERQGARVATRGRAGAADELDRAASEQEREAGELNVSEARAAEARAAGRLEDALQIPFPVLSALKESAFSLAR